jgi:DNA-directed RNA polymerase subunit RPC12/RpoP
VGLRPGVYLSCAACGKLLAIRWATRSIVCSCGARVTPPAKNEK